MHPHTTMEAILDFSGELDIPTLDKTVQEFYQGNGASQKRAQEILQQFQDHPSAWTRADTILQYSQNPYTKYIALSILDKLIQHRWKALPQEQRTGIRNFVANMIIALCDNDEQFTQQRALINKCNLTLVQIIKQDWPQEWETFVPEIVASSRAGFNVCENNMTILRLLSEEVFDYSEDQMTQAKARQLKDRMCAEFSGIFQLCFEVLSKASGRPSLVKATLHALLKYVPWIPLGFIFETEILVVVANFLQDPQFRGLALKCLTESCGLSAPPYEAQAVAVMKLTLEKVALTFPVSEDLRARYRLASAEEQAFLQDLAVFLVTSLSRHVTTLEQAEPSVALVAHEYLVGLSRVEERELFKTCLDYWGEFVGGLYREMESVIKGSNVKSALSQLTQTGGGAPDPAILSQHSLRMHSYSSVLSQLRTVVIESMAKPEEVLVVENDEGEIVREFVRESDTIQLYKSMREVLVYLTHLDVLDTESIMSEKLARQIDGSEWSWHNINTLCWAIGSISGSMNEEMEKKFLVTVIRDLLDLTGNKRGKDNKAVVASNIMYIVGQYPRFLKAHWKFLKTVVNKLFEFMHETHEGVQDMACDTFIKIASKCKRHFVTHHPGETEPFIREIVANVQTITEDLQPQQVHTFYKACGIIVSAEPASQRQALLGDLMSLPNMAWSAIVQQAGNDPQLLSNGDTLRIIANILKTNVAVCSSMEQSFYPQLSLIYLETLSLYGAVSKMISDTVAAEGLIATKTPKVRGLRTIKKEVLRLVETFVAKCDDRQLIVRDLVQPLLSAVLVDYAQNVPDARDAEALNCMATLVDKVGALIPAEVVQMLQHLFEPTLEMISKDLTEYPDHRVEFYKMLRLINKNCFSALVQLPAPAFKSFVDAVLWGVKHNNRQVEESALQLGIELLYNIQNSKQPDFQTSFYQNFYFSILSDVFYVLTDSDHKSGFKEQAQLLAILFSVVETGAVTAPLYQPDQAPANTANSLFLKEFLANMLLSAFPNLQPDQVSSFISVLIPQHSDQNKLKRTLRDFLVQIKSVGGDPTDYLFADDRESELAEKQRLERERASQVGGLLKPSEMED